jgi:hypothetical protein
MERPASAADERYTAVMLAAVHWLASLPVSALPTAKEVTDALDGLKRSQSSDDGASGPPAALIASGFFAAMLDPERAKPPPLLDSRKRARARWRWVRQRLLGPHNAGLRQRLLPELPEGVTSPIVSPRRGFSRVHKQDIFAAAKRLQRYSVSRNDEIKVLGKTGAEALFALDMKKKEEDIDPTMIDGDIHDSELQLFETSALTSNRSSIWATLERAWQRVIRVRSPDEPYVVTWHFISLVLLGSFAMIAPVELGFGIDFAQESTVLYIFFQTVTLWFLMDIVLCFHTAYIENGKLIQDRKRVAKNYITSWFILDFVASFPYDWILPNEGSRTKYAKISRLAKFGRFMRTLKVLRMVRISTTFSSYMDELPDEVEVWFSLLANFAFVFVVLGHWLGCFWSGQVYQSDAPSWLMRLQQEFPDIALDTRVDVYRVSLAWAIGQLTTVGSVVEPSTQTEVLVKALCDCIGAIVLIFFTARFTDLLVRIGAEKKASRSKVKEVLQYLRGRGIPLHLRVRVKRYLQHVVSAQSRQIDATMLEKVSASLRAELMCVMVGGQLRYFPLFSGTEEKVLAKLSTYCDVITCGQGDTIEYDGEQTLGLFMVSEGQVTIVNADGKARILGEHGYFGQTSLFRMEVRRGTVRADQLTELVHLSRDALQAFMGIYPILERQFSAIAAALHAGRYDAVYEDEAVWARELEIMEDPGLAQGNVLGTFPTRASTRPPPKKNGINGGVSGTSL